MMGRTQGRDNFSLFLFFLTELHPKVWQPVRIKCNLAASWFTVVTTQHDLKIAGKWRPENNSYTQKIFESIMSV